MKKTIFVKNNLLKESFCKLDARVRKNIYIYLWCAISLRLILSYLYSPFLDTSIVPYRSYIVIYIILSLFNIFSIISLVILILKIKTKFLLEQITDECIFGIELQLLPFLHIFSYILVELIELSEFFKESGRNDPLYIFLTTFHFVIILWALKDILYLRQHAFKKID